MRSKYYEYLILFLVLLTNCFTFYLHWHNPPSIENERVRKSHFLEPVESVLKRSRELTCSIDAQCKPLETCLINKCVPFWPALPANKTSCHITCIHDIRLYENHFYLQTVGHFEHFQFHDHCVVAYQHSGKSAGLSISDYESQRYRTVLRRKRQGSNLIVALCSTVDIVPVTKEVRKDLSLVPLPSLRGIDPFIGTSSTGHTTPGAKAPFGMMYMVPVNEYNPMGSNWWDYTTGYQYGDKTFSEIAHTALTGAGISGWLDIKISPFAESRTMDKITEVAHPGFFSVTIDGVNIAVVAGNRFGIHQYIGTSQLFLKSKRCSVVSTKNKISGSCRAYFNDKWEKQKYPYTVHFYIILPFGCEYKHQKITCPHNDIEMKIAISNVDQDGAKANFKDENTDWNSVYKKKSAEWANTMDKLQVHGWRSQKHHNIFSSSLYRTLLSHYTHNDADGRIRGLDGKIYTVAFTYYTFLSTWDTYRTWSSVIRLVRPDVLTDIAKHRSFIII